MAAFRGPRAPAGAAPVRSGTPPAAGGRSGAHILPLSGSAPVDPDGRSGPVLAPAQGSGSRAPSVAAGPPCNHRRAWGGSAKAGSAVLGWGRRCAPAAARERAANGGQQADRVGVRLRTGRRRAQQMGGPAGTGAPSKRRAPPDITPASPAVAAAGRRHPHRYCRKARIPRRICGAARPQAGARG